MMVRIRRDPEAIAAYRRILAEHRVADVDDMSDEVVIETMERTVNAVLDVGRVIARAMERMRPAVLRAASAITNLYATAGGAILAAETEMDLRLRDEVGLDGRLLALFDDDKDGAKGGKP